MPVMNQMLLSDDQIAEGKEALYKVAIHMRGLQVLTEMPGPQDEEVTSILNSESFSSNEELDFEACLNKMELPEVKRRHLIVENQ